MITSVLDWETPLQLSAHHYARQFLDHGWRVGFVAAPTTVFHAAMTLTSTDHRRRFRTVRRGIQSTDGERLTHLLPLTGMPLSGRIGLRYRWMMGHWQSFSLPNPHRALRNAGLAAPDLMIIDTPLYAYLVHALRPKRVVARIVDFTPGFMGVHDAWIEMEREMVQRADLVVYSSKELESYVAEDLGAHKPLYLPHGVSIERFSGSADPPAEYDTIPRPRAVYVGSMREWFDFELLDVVAADLPHVSFVLIGPKPAVISTAVRRRNVHLLGERPHGALPAYLQHADVGIIPFDVRGKPELVHGIHPLKLYEYLAASLPVVSTAWRTIEALQSPALLTNTSAEFADAVRSAIGNPSRALIEAGRAWVEEKSWRHRWTQLMTESAPPERDLR